MKLEMSFDVQNGVETPSAIPNIIPIEASNIVCIKYTWNINRLDAPRDFRVAIVAVRFSRKFRTAFEMPNPPTRSAVSPINVKNWVTCLLKRSKPGTAFFTVRIRHPAAELQRDGLGARDERAERLRLPVGELHAGHRFSFGARALQRFILLSFRSPARQFASALLVPAAATLGDE